MCPPLAARLKDAQLITDVKHRQLRVRVHTFAAATFVMVGDAYAFVDPMFSSGVNLAMNSAFESASAVDHWLKGEFKVAEKQFRRFEKVMIHGPKMFSWFIYRITSPAIRKIFMQPRNVWRMQEALLSILAGDLFRDTPVGPRLLAFKFIYYVSCVSIWPQAFKTWLWRRNNVKKASSEAPTGAVYIQDSDGRSRSAQS